MSDGNIERLIALLKTEEEGEEIASLLNEFLIDDNKKNTLIIRLKEIKAEVATLSQEVTLTEAEKEIRNIVLAEKKPIIAEEVAKKISERNGNAVIRGFRYNSGIAAVKIAPFVTTRLHRFSREIVKIEEVREQRSEFCFLFSDFWSCV